MTRWLVLLSALLVLAAACNDDDDGDDAQPPPANGDVEPPAPPPDDDGTEAWTSCTNDEDGWTAEHPADWHVNDGTVVAPCSLFDPDPVEVPEPPGGEVPADIAVQLRAEEIVTDFDDFLQDPFVEVTDEQEVTVDGHTGYRQEQRHTGGGFYPEGMQSVRYTVEWGDDRVLVAVSHDVGEPDFATKVEVLDEMLQRLRLDDDGDVGTAPAEVEGAWVELAEAPIDSRLNHSATWSGDRLILWGGGDAQGVEADGAAFDPATDQWRALPAAPIDARWGHHASWTGDRLLVWGGTAGPDHLAECFTDGALYDPAAGTWEAVPPAPGADQRCGASVAWSGDELLVFGGYDDTGPPTTGTVLDDGAAFDPATGQWRLIPPAPVEARWGAEAAWTGTELVVVGGTGDGDVDEVSGPLGDGAAYDPAADQWRTIASSPLEPRTGGLAVWTGDELVVLGGRDVTGEETRDFTDGAAYDPQADTWRSIADLPGDARTGAAIARGDEVVYIVGGDTLGGDPDGSAELDVHALAWEPGSDTWYELPDPPGTPRTDHAATWTGDDLLVWGGQIRGEGPDAEAPFVAWRPDLADAEASVEVFWTPTEALDHDCSVVEPVERSVATPAVLEAAMRNLLAGPTDDEEAAGLTSWFSADTAGMLRSVDVADGVARVDFEDFSTVIPNASTSCGSQMLLAQLGSTATQFDGIDEAVYSFDGDVEAFYQWLQLVPPQT